MTIRDNVVAVALSVQDLRAAIPETRSEFRDLLGPPPKGASWDLSVPFSCKKNGDKYVTKGVSTCGLVAAGILRRAGVMLPWNGSPYWQSPAPYRGLDIVSELSLLGVNAKCRRGAGDRLAPGDIACIGTGLGTHVLTAVDWEGDTLVSVDGGQIDDWQHGYLQRIKICRRVWDYKRVAWVIDVDRLVASRSTPATDAWTVADTQRRLADLGFDPGPIDGIVGRRTRAAVIAFQHSVGLVPDGVVGPLTRAALSSS